MMHNFAAVHADDAYLDELGGAQPEPLDDLSILLLAWRQAVDSELIEWPAAVLHRIYGRCA